MNSFTKKRSWTCCLLSTCSPFYNKILDDLAPLSSCLTLTMQSTKADPCCHGHFACLTQLIGVTGPCAIARCAWTSVATATCKSMDPRRETLLECSIHRLGAYFPDVSDIIRHSPLWLKRHIHHILKRYWMGGCFVT